jgi:hypothetical protein
MSKADAWQAGFESAKIAAQAEITRLRAENERLREDCEKWFHLALEMFERFQPANLTMQSKQREWAGLLGIDINSLYGGQDDAM